MDKVSERQHDATTDLGSIETETKGTLGVIEDVAGLQQPFMGLTEE